MGCEGNSVDEMVWATLTLEYAGISKLTLEYAVPSKLRQTAQRTSGEAGS